MLIENTFHQNCHSIIKNEGITQKTKTRILPPVDALDCDYFPFLFINDVTTLNYLCFMIPVNNKLKIEGLLN